MVAAVKKVLVMLGAALALGISGATTVMQAQGTPIAGEFRVGDRIELVVEPPLAIADTLLVREGLVVTIPTVGDISLRGVRRSDVKSYLTQQLSKYAKDPVVKATVLLRLSISGPVGRPGFYEIPTDRLLSDVIMIAGGPAQQADNGKTVIKRDGREVIGKGAVAQALRNGRTLNDLGLLPGDEILVGTRTNRSALSYLQIVSTLLALTIGLITLSRRF
jgi:protein involved in polysaccharide export with SLBB domain